MEGPARKVKDNSSLSSENTNENLKILAEASVYKAESRRQTLTHQRSDSGPEITDNDVAVSLLADLQDRQDREAERYLQQMTDKVCNVLLYASCPQ